MLAEVQHCKPKKPKSSRRSVMRRRKKTFKSVRRLRLKPVRSLKRQIRRLTLRQSSLESETNALESQLNALGSRIAGFGSDIRTIFANVSTLSERISRLQEQDTSLDAQLRLLRAEVGQLADPFAGLRSALENRLNTAVTIETNAGPVSGTLIAIGTDFVEILEPNGDLAFIPLNNVNQLS